MIFLVLRLFYDFFDWGIRPRRVLLPPTFLRDGAPP
jgi:hypothetical protein